MTRVIESPFGDPHPVLIPGAAGDSLENPPMADALRSRGLAFFDGRDDPRLALETPPALIELLPVAIHACDAAGRILWFNARAAALWGRSPAIGIRQDDDVAARALQAGQGAEGVRSEIARPDGSILKVELNIEPVRDLHGLAIGAMIVTRALNDNDNSEEKHKVMLNELNHRVKNNMQMMSALLKGAERETSTPEGRVALADAGQRIAAMVTAQQVLYAAGRGDTFEVRGFLEAVCERAVQAVGTGVGGTGVGIVCEAEPADLSNDAAIPLALIVNELLTNAVKHGMADRAEGIVRLRFATEETGGHVLSVADEGPGFIFERSRKRSSGLGLVAGLARQLGGGLETVPGPGGRVLVRIAARA